MTNNAINDNLTIPFQTKKAKSISDTLGEFKQSIGDCDAIICIAIKQEGDQENYLALASHATHSIKAGMLETAKDILLKIDRKN